MSTQIKIFTEGENVKNLSDLPFSHEMLTKYFKNTKDGKEEFIHIKYSVYGDGGYIGDVMYCKSAHQYTFFIDNFPGQKKWFQSNIPYKSLLDFIGDMKRIGLNLILRDEYDYRTPIQSETMINDLKALVEERNVKIKELREELELAKRQ